MEDYRLDQSGQEVQNILDGAAMQSDLTAETDRAELAEEGLQGNIDIEERDRKSADVTLQGNIDAEEVRAKAAEKQNADDIDAIEEKIPSGASSSNKMATAGDISSLDAAIEAIMLLIPSAATSLNQLADKAFVNSSIATATATFRGTYNLVNDLGLMVSATHAQIATALGGSVTGEDNNDYAFVQIPTSDATPTQIAKTERYKFNGTAWEYEYDLNNSGYTAAQWAAINSGITEALVTKLSALPTNADLTTALGVLTEGIAAINAKIPSAASSSNKLVDNSAMVAYIGQIIDAIDATFNVTSADGHVTVQITQVNGVITNVAVTTSDIASAADMSLLAERVTTAEGYISTNAEDIAELQDLYNALQQSDPQVIEPTDTWPVANPSTTVIYRVVDRVNTPPQYYSDYMFRASDLTTPVLMATYNNAIDPRPKKGSQNLVTSGGVFDNMGSLDVSELNATENPHTLATYADLSAAIAAIPSDYQKGGMTIRFVQSSDNKYVQFRSKTESFSTDPEDWQGVDDEPTVGSDNLVKSGGVKKYTDENFARQDINSLSDLDFVDDSRNVVMRLKDGHIKTKNFDSENIGNENIRNGAIDDTKLSKVHPFIEEKKVTDLSIIDNNGNVLANYHDGIHETKKPSPYTIKNSNGDDIDIEDANRNRILSIKGGHIKTKNFDSESVINDVEEIKEIIDVDKKFGIELEAIEIPASISEFPTHRLKLVATKKDNYFCYDNPPILMPQDRGYLYVVQETKKFYYSPNLYNRPEYLFDWQTVISGVAIDSNPNSYMYIISKDGDIICVPQGKSAENYGRKNPIVYPHNDYTNPVIVDLTTIGDGYLITGMTTDNNSCVYCYGNFILIAEYQADGYGDGDPLRIWKATAPFTSPSNWKIVCQYEHLNTAEATTPEADAGKITHFHTVCYDHFSGRFYANTGDASSLIRVLESTDMGETWTQIEGGHQKWRTLGYIFTKDACYWGTDAAGADHAMYKASRVNGVIDFSTTVELCKLYKGTDNGQRVYCCCQTKNPNGILVLERAEPRWDGNFDVPFYSFDDNKLYFIAELKALPEYIDTTNPRGDGRYGFGNEAQTYYQSVQENGIICGASSYDRSLRLDILNNSVSNMLGVTKIKVVKY